MRLLEFYGGRRLAIAFEVITASSAHGERGGQKEGEESGRPTEHTFGELPGHDGGLRASEGYQGVKDKKSKIPRCDACSKD